jgi:hypothetical protein
VYEYDYDDSLWDVYEMLGLREAQWIREVDAGVRIVVFPRS